MTKRAPEFPTAQVVRILLLVATLAAVIVMKYRCGPAVEQMFRAIDSTPSDGGLTSRDAARN